MFQQTLSSGSGWGGDKDKIDDPSSSWNVENFIQVVKDMVAYIIPTLVLFC